MDAKRGTKASDHPTELSSKQGIQRVKMSRKLDKNQKERCMSSVSRDLQDEDGEKPLEPYVCTGNFQADFTELCQRNNMAVVPSVVLRPRPPSSTPQMSEGKPERGKEKGKQPVPVEPEIEIKEDGEQVDAPPKTYVTKDKFEYFKPTVQVEMDNPDKADTVSEIYIRGWKVDDTMMAVLQQCCPMLEKLHTINLWHAGLTGETVENFTSFLGQCINLRNLILDGNWLKEENWHELIGEDSLVQNLSLRNCSISDKGAATLGATLGSTKKANTKLLSLNLAGNRITDTGCEHISRGLRMNRTLLSLSLASNKIGDKGASKMAETLSRFPLTHEEVVERRRQVSEKGSPERNKSPSPSRRADSQTRPPSVRSGTHNEKDKSKRDKPSAKQKKDPKAKDVKEDDKKGGTRKDKDDKGATKKAQTAADAGKTAGKTRDKKRDKKPTPQETEMPDVLEVIRPLLEVADHMDGQLWVAGNRVLINLNLSRNLLSDVGAHALLKAMQYQTTLTLDSKNSGTGIMRLNIERNDISCEHDLLKKMNDLMTPKDPFYKPPVTPNGEPMP